MGRGGRHGGGLSVESFRRQSMCLARAVRPKRHPDCPDILEKALTDGRTPIRYQDVPDWKVLYHHAKSCRGGTLPFRANCDGH